MTLFAEEKNKENVYEAYERIAEWYDNERSKQLDEKEYLDFIIQNIPNGGSILDLGCGGGQPIAQFFIEHGYDLVGIDGSKKMIQLCQKRFPNRTFIEGDMREINLNQKFHAIVAWDSFFHLPKPDQRRMFPLFQEHCFPHGVLIFTSGAEDSEVWSENGGELLFHASLSENEYMDLLAQNEFKVLRHKVKDPNCGGRTVWVAQHSS